MKRPHNLVLLAAFLTCDAAAQPAELSLPNVSASPGASLLLSVRFESRLSSVAAVQFDLQYDNKVLTLTAVVGEAARNSGKALYFTDLALNTRRFLVRGLNQNPIIDGNLIDLFIAVNQAALPRPYTLQFSNVVGSDTSGQQAYVLAADGAVTIVGAPDPSSHLLPGGVLNAASLLPGPVAPGEILTFLGAGIGPSSPQQSDGSPTSTVLGEPPILFDGVPAPLLYAGINQINAVAPYEICDKATTQVLVSQRGQGVAGVILPVTNAAPAVFTADGSGTGQGAIINEDQVLNSPSKPALRGSVMTLFATGAGQTDPTGVDGQVAAGTLPKPLLPISVWIGGMNASVLYAGAAPGGVAGLLQVNCIVPLTAPTGLTVPIVLVVGTASSQAGVTIAIR